MHSKNSMASPTPIVDGDRLYVHFGHMGTAALDLAGNVIWRQHRSLSSATRQRRLAHAGRRSSRLQLRRESDPFVAALDRATGDVRWNNRAIQRPAKTFSFSTPTVIEVDGVETSHQRRQRFRRRVRSGRWPRNLAFVTAKATQSCLARLRKRIALRRLRLRPIRSLRDRPEECRRATPLKTNIVWTLEKGAPLTPSVLVVGDELYFVSDNGVATCIDARTDEKPLDQTPRRRLLRLADCGRWPHLLPKRSRRDDGREGRHGIRIAQRERHRRTHAGLAHCNRRCDLHPFRIAPLRIGE